MRLLKGSGVDGLAAMAPKSPGLFDRDITILRPFLGVSKARLKATLVAKNHPWISDPSNENQNFTRVKIRALLKNSNDLDHKTLARTAARLARVKGFLKGLTEDFLADAFVLHPAGYGVLKKELFFNGGLEIALRCLSKILTFISQNDYPPGLEKLERLYSSLEKDNFKGVTLHGCRVSPIAGGDFLVCREAQKAGEAFYLNPGENALWDKRFRVAYKRGRGPLKVKALGEQGWETFARQYPEVKDIDIPHPARGSMPAFFRGGEVVAAPHFNFSREDFVLEVEFKPKKPLFREIL